MQHPQIDTKMKRLKTESFEIETMQIGNMNTNIIQIKLNTNIKNKI